MFLIVNENNIAYACAWFVFILIMIGAPSIIFAMYNCHFCSRKSSKRQKKNYLMKLLKYLSFYWLLGLFYMAFIIDSIECKYIFGILIVLNIFYSLVNYFIYNKKFGFLALVQDILIGVSITIYLISLITDEALQNIITNIISALFGGFVTLLGVAWTIKDNHNNRKEDERKNKIPYLLTSTQTSGKTFVAYDVDLIMDDEQSKSAFSFEKFNLKISNNSDCIPFGVVVDGKVIKFINKSILEKGATFIVDLQCGSIRRDTFNHNVYLICKDVIGYYYKYKLMLKFITQNSNTDDNSGTHIEIYKCEINDVGIPELIDTSDLIFDELI